MMNTGAKPGIVLSEQTKESLRVLFGAEPGFAALLDKLAEISKKKPHTFKAYAYMLRQMKI